MVTRRRAGILCLVAAVALMAGVRAVYRPAHPPDTACGVCHLAGEGVTEPTASVLVATQERLCVACHKGAVADSHPSGFPPGRALPAGLPLDWKGDLTCSTCHEVHGDGPGRLRGGIRGREFCLRCHEQTFFDSMSDRGLSLADSGHAAAWGDVNALGLDPYSVQCMTCHGAEGDQGVPLDAYGVVRHASGSVNHPVGVAYTVPNRYGHYRPESTLPAEVLLPGGKVGCVSCHKGYAGEHGGLVMSNEGSRLCLACHDQ